MLNAKAEKTRPPRPQRPSAPAGFTLIEVLVTIVVIAIGCLAAIQLQASAMRGGAQAYQLTVGSFLAESEIERLQSIQKVQFEDLSREDENLTEYLSQEGTVCQGCTDLTTDYPFRRTRTIYKNQPTSRSYRVVLELEWLDGQGRRSARYETALTDLSF